jgi:hypothetical protein
MRESERERAREREGVVRSAPCAYSQQITGANVVLAVFATKRRQHTSAAYVSILVTSAYVIPGANGVLAALGFSPFTAIPDVCVCVCVCVCV